MRYRLFAVLATLLLAPALGLAFEPTVPSEPDASEAGAEPDITVGAGTDVVSRYVSRGAATGVGAALQSGVWLSGRSLTLTIWQNMPVARADGRGAVNEWNTVLAWERPWRGSAVEAAVTRYSFPNQEDAPSTHELSLRLSRPLGDYEVFILGLTDFGAYSGAWMAEAGASRAWELSPRIGLEASTALLWGNGRFNESNTGCPDSGFGALTAAVSLPIDIGRGLCLRPHAEWHELPDRRIRAAAGDRRYFTFGLALETDG